MKLSIYLTLFLVAGLAAGSVARLRGESLTTVSGKTYQNVEVIQVGSDHLVIRSDSGTANIPLSELSAEVRRRFSAEQLFAELRRRTEELARVRVELALARQEIAELKGNKAGAGTPASTSPATPTARPTAVSIPAVPPLESLPALNSDDLVEVEEMIAHFKTDPLGAERRYRKKTFRIRGRIERFEEKLFVRNTDVILESFDRSLRLVCNLPFPDEFKAVLSKQEGRSLVGLTTSSERELLRVGQSVVFKGRCLGLRNSMVVFQNCEQLR